MNSLLSAHGVPQIAGVLGDCIAGGGYMPIISDKLFMTEQAYMVIAGAALVKGGKSQKITSLSIGGPDVHVHLSNCADERVPDDQTMIQRIRQEVETLPASAATYYRHGFAPAEPRFAPRELNGLLPVDHRVVYDAHSGSWPRTRARRWSRASPASTGCTSGSSPTTRSSRPIRS
jgi:acetyl-CoA carboxylase carboxyltransferase component